MAALQQIILTAYKGGDTMKKAYKTPDIQFDSFALSTHIAACKVHNYTMSNGDCGFQLGSRFLFVEGINGCKTVIEDGSMYDGLCYHVPTDTNNLFNS